MSRSYALHKNYSAHIEVGKHSVVLDAHNLISSVQVYKSLNEHLMDHQNKLDFSTRGVCFCYLLSALHFQILERF